MIKQIVDLLLRSERKLNEDVNFAVRNKLSVLSQQKQNAETTLGQLTDCFDFIEESLKMSTPQQVLLAKPQMIDRTNRVIKSFNPESFQPLEQADIKLVKSEKIEDIHKSIGDVRCSLSISSLKPENGGIKLECYYDILYCDITISYKYRYIVIIYALLCSFL